MNDRQLTELRSHLKDLKLDREELLRLRSRVVTLEAALNDASSCSCCGYCSSCGSEPGKHHFDKCEISRLLEVKQ